MIRRIAAVLATLTVAAAASLTVITPAAAQPGQPANCHPVHWRFVNRYNQAPGGYGCAVGWEFGRDGGLVQDFERGQMAWSPRQGDGMIVSAFHQPQWYDWGLRYGLTVQYGQTNPFNYDRWLIRLDHNGTYIRQEECIVGSWMAPCTRTGGSWGWGNLAPGLYRMVVEGCDWNSWSGHTCRQSWTNPIWVWF